ncbi:MAG TPA: AMP-binding protein [Acidimicrobiia bacterium]|nr:AMP-binding protein [Acidimicrobiia bacterium]
MSAAPMLDDVRSVWDLIEQRAAATPDRVMLYDGERVTTFEQYKTLVERAAAGLHALGIGAEDHVSWQLPTWTESAVLVGALCRLGAVQNPMLPIYRYREVSFIASQTGCKLLITPSTWNGFDYAALAERVAGENDGMHTLIADHRNPDGDPATLPPAADLGDPVRWIFYTSGTTADPKGAQHTDRSALAGAIGYAEKTHVQADDIALVAFPFTHIGGIIIGVFTPLLTGSAAVLMEAWTPGASTELIRRHRITLGNGAPAIHAALLAEARANPEAYKTIRAFPSGGSTKPPQLHDELMEAVPGCAGITSGYGMTEAPIVSQTDIDAPDTSKRTGEGTPTRGVTMKVLDSGELVVKGPQVMRGYVDSALDKDAFTDDGWLHTGDMARFDEHGAVEITGRIKDIIIRKGENVSAKEVEDVLYAHPKVGDVAVLGIPDEERGEMVVAFVVPKDAGDPPTMLDVREHCKAVGLMTQKIPERIEIIGEMPRNPSGKVPKHQLRARIT